MAQKTAAYNTIIRRRKIFFLTHVMPIVENIFTEFVSCQLHTICMTSLDSALRKTNYILVNKPTTLENIFATHVPWIDSVKDLQDEFASTLQMYRWVYDAHMQEFYGHEQECIGYETSEVLCDATQTSVFLVDLHENTCRWVIPLVNEIDPHSLLLAVRLSDDQYQLIQPRDS